MTQSILLIDDEPHIADVVVYVLEENGFKTATALSGEAGLRAFRAKRPDLVVLDLNLPGISGLDLFQQIKKIDPAIPVIMLTAKAEEVDRVLGLEIGADDYVTKPFSPRELAARVRAVLRRANGAGKTAAGIIRHGPFAVDSSSYILSYFRQRIMLSRPEFRLLESLIRFPARVFTRENLMEIIYQGETFVADRSIDAHVKRIRRKLSEVRSALDPIQTVYGIGYKLNQEIEEAV
ncbi:MAG: response regulator [Candidatus Aureabacteria bacterium]|nr:response regulator [Candidatus Auribacterota bacterium]